jgi:nucleotide-binding universal stress UspA family protein
MKILIATGGSDYSFMAVEKACEMVIKPESSEIRIISVYQDLINTAPEPLDISPEQFDEIQNIGRVNSTQYALAAEEIIRNHFPDNEIKISMQAVKGLAKKMILEEAEKWKPDLIVVGSLGHNFLSRMFIGSVSEAIVRHAKCSVLVVRDNVEEI